MRPILAIGGYRWEIKTAYSDVCSCPRHRRKERPRGMFDAYNISEILWQCSSVWTGMSCALYTVWNVSHGSCAYYACRLFLASLLPLISFVMRLVCRTVVVCIYIYIYIYIKWVNCIRERVSKKLSAWRESKVIGQKIFSPADGSCMCIFKCN